MVVGLAVTVFVAELMGDRFVVPGRFVGGREMEEHTFQIAVSVRGGDRLGRVVGDDPTVREEHDAFAHLHDVAHVVTRHQQRGAVAIAEVEQTPRTRCATSGSSDAVGSSSTSRRGRCNVARTMPMSVRCPDDSSVPIALGQIGDAETFETLVDERVRIGDAVELAVEPQVLAHAHALGERQVSGRETDALRGLAALVREVETADRHRTLVG